MPMPEGSVGACPTWRGFAAEGRGRRTAASLRGMLVGVREWGREVWGEGEGVNWRSLAYSIRFIVNVQEVMKYLFTIF